MNIENKVKEVENINNNTPNGQIIDADTILADLVENNEMEVSGTAQDVFDIWHNSTDRKSVEDIFKVFTGINFEEYLVKCQNDITR